MFVEVSFHKLALLAGASVLLCAGFIVILLKKHRNVWGAAKKCGLPILCILLGFTLCGQTDSGQTIPHSDETYYEIAEMRCYFDYENNTIYMDDLETGDVTELLRSPLSTMSDTQILPVLYDVGNKVYCMMTTTDSYIDRIGVFAGSHSRV